ncbi:SIR2 family NAD-dependent protein deacylase [Rubellimicrobium roseum]|uniref:Sir2 family NAD-dependent protein deacetylase n=1 Tax=Rubellimicrobium roseum TaxID=687525 RepID=A0A5C4NCD4_9RHOB|nr:SIR2 family protein [Rubellimicrobium roseum]TNC68503.1 Sir2 family NAD-dependent protein deacetylase [Rubellimicrobium roseum]
MQDDLDDLAASVRDRRAILFVGAGISMTVGLPSWQALIDHIMEELGLEPETDPEASLGHPILAEYYRIRYGTIGPLRSWMDREWKVSEDSVRDSRIHQLIVSLGFPLIYTTNYDRNLEVAFEAQGQPYVKIANERDLTIADPTCTQIVKFHGDFEDDASLVITESDYFSRMSFDSPLDVKFRADAMSRTLLFIGYSLRDLNIRLLLHRIWESWSRSPYERNRPRSYIFLPRAGPAQKAVLARWGLTVVTSQTTDPEAGLTDFLERLSERVRDGADETPGRRK